MLLRYAAYLLIFAAERLYVAARCHAATLDIRVFAFARLLPYAAISLLIFFAMPLFADGH